MVLLKILISVSLNCSQDSLKHVGGENVLLLFFPDSSPPVKVSVSSNLREFHSSNSVREVPLCLDQDLNRDGDSVTHWKPFHELESLGVKGEDMSLPYRIIDIGSPLHS